MSIEYSIEDGYFTSEDMRPYTPPREFQFSNVPMIISDQENIPPEEDQEMVDANFPSKEDMLDESKQHLEEILLAEDYGDSIFPVDEEFVMNLYENERVGRSIASGSFGTVYTMRAPYEDLVFKVSNLCTNQHDELCRMAMQNILIEYYPRTDRDHVNVQLANFILEMVIGVHLPDVLKYRTPCFNQIYRGMYGHDSNNEHRAITILERELPYESFMRTDKDKHVFLYLVLYSLVMAQTHHRFVHFDLHDANVLARRIQGGMNLEFTDETYHIETDFIPVIMDYGFSRMEFGSVEAFGAYKGMHNWMNTYAFCPYVDFLTLLYSMYTLNPAMREVCTMVFTLFIGVRDMSRLNTMFATNWFRPYIHRWSNKQLQEQVFGTTDLTLDMIELLEKYTQYMVNSDYMTLKEGSPGPNTYNAKLGSLSTQYYMNTAIQQDVFGFENRNLQLDCCRIDVIDFLQSQQGDVAAMSIGILIDEEYNYSPRGTVYIEGQKLVDVPIGEVYHHLFRTAVIHNGTLSIHPFHQYPNEPDTAFDVLALFEENGDYSIPDDLPEEGDLKRTVLLLKTDGMLEIHLVANSSRRQLADYYETDANVKGAYLLADEKANLAYLSGNIIHVANLGYYESNDYPQLLPMILSWKPST